MDNINFYNKNAEDFKKRTSIFNMSKQYEAFIEEVGKSGKILDLGCGPGRDSKHFIDLGYEVVSMDASFEMCKLCEELTHQKAVCKRFDELNYKYEFDGIWACASLLHVPIKELKTVLRKISLSLKFGGTLYASFKMGKGERIEKDRSFSDLMIEDVPEYFNNSTGFHEVSIFITEDIREDVDRKWINIIAKKHDLRDCEYEEYSV